MSYSVIVRLSGAPAAALAVEWTDRDAPGAGDWEPCLPAGPNLWRFSTREGAAPRHRRGPGRWTGLAIRYRLEPAGPWSEASADRKEIEIVAAPGQGEDMPPPPLAPVLVLPPALLGAGKIGQTMTAEPGGWTGAEQIALQWLRDGAAIAGATAATYTPGPEDDRATLAVRVAATGPGGTTEFVTAPVAITHVAPVAKVTEVLDEIHDAGSGAQTVETAEYFAGAALVFAVTGAGATIDPATGRVSLPTDAALVEEMVVTAANSGGAATLRFLVTIEAVPLLVALEPEEWEIVDLAEDPAHPGRVTAVFRIAADCPAAKAVACYWTDVSLENPNIIPHPTWDLGLDGEGRRRFRMRPAWLDTNTWHTRQPGESKGNIAIAYRLDPLLVDTGSHMDHVEHDGTNLPLLSPYSLDRKSFSVPADFFAPAAGGPRPPAATEMRSSVTHRGVTWTFSKPMPIGTYWNGDPFVVNAPGAGGFAITSVTPNSVNRTSGAYSGTRMHGLMRNPAHPRNQGFDGSNHAPTDGGGQPVYQEALNANPNLKGNIVYSAGQEESLVKAISKNVAGSNNSAYWSIYADFAILTVVREVPAEGAFRPSPHGSVRAKSSPWRTDDLRMGIVPRVPVAHLPASGYHSLNGAMRIVQGPWPCWTFGSRAVRAYHADGVTWEQWDAFYGPELARGIGSWFAHLSNAGTPDDVRQALAARMVQIGIDYGQALEAGAAMPTTFWGRVHVLPLLVAGLMLGHQPFLAAGGSASSASTDPWARWHRNNSTTNTGTSLMNSPVTSNMLSLVPPEGSGFSEGWWPRATPYTNEHIGYPLFGLTGGRSGVTASPNEWYGKAAMIGVLPYGLLAAMSGGEAVVNDDVLIDAYDRIGRWFAGHYAGQWDMNETNNDTVDFTRGGHAMNWTRAHSDLYAKTRSRISRPVWIWRPEQPTPPLLSRPGAGQLRIEMTRWQPDNGQPLTGRQYRYRRIAFSGGVTGDAARQAIFYNSASWTGPVDFNGTATLTGLAAGWYQVQVRTGNARGWSPWSTNVSWRSDGGAVAGLPAGPRAVISI